MAKKKTRRRFTDDEKKALARRMMEAMRAGQTFKEAADALEIEGTQARVYLDRFGKEFGWTGSAKEVAKEVAPEKRSPTTVRRAPADAPKADDAWARQLSAQLGLGLSGESEEPESTDGDTLMSRPEPPASEMGGLVIHRPPPERETRRYRRREREEPLYEAEPVREEPPPSPPPSSAALIEGELLKQALREKDAVLTTLEILLREGRIKIPH
jgi:hypothetical protein